MKTAVIVFPGSNCDRDLARAFERVSGRPSTMVWHKETALPSGLDVVALPGGFSFGDYLRCGAIAARSPIMRAVAEFAQGGGHVLGICNGFQVLLETGLLPGALLRNAGLNFVCRDVHLNVETTDSPFTNAWHNGGVARIPVAHHDGNYLVDDSLLDRLHGESRVAFTYCDALGNVTDEANPNGSVSNIAGVLSPNRRVLGMMPHPERLCDPALGGSDGAKVFESLLGALAPA
ncbi:phosphoribosylformylglycinamidine synthase subunit PurQ [Oceanicella sp. SM1341]|uniref:phosphoribosylformylglycinamidine synthase subunit PurQ n=1 Tax=Oceanicella sp. SM1341 TaxID=1548889 RepID=UPI000E4EA315|nr:phosphoribosylformylglycinamidine synthase subunit PurQ [Oceanicella sp. SM1341]